MPKDKGPASKARQGRVVDLAAAATMEVILTAEALEEMGLRTEIMVETVAEIMVAVGGYLSFRCLV